MAAVKPSAVYEHSFLQPLCPPALCTHSPKMFMKAFKSVHQLLKKCSRREHFFHTFISIFPFKQPADRLKMYKK
jgi:hypothetical protein